MILYNYSCAVCGMNSANVRHKKLHVVLTETYLYEPCRNKFRILSFGLMVGKIESSGTACLFCLTREVNRRPEVYVYVRLLKLLLGPLRSQTFPGQPRLTAQSGYHKPSSTSFLFSSGLFSLSSTSFVSLCFTLCLHITLWVVPNWNIWSFSGPPCQESVHFLWCRKFSSPHWGIIG